ncbi:MAG TPA: hypothetical protein VKU40_01080 [Thermoanaerobaculia bacterium]|nr:hypothetical protein [Thermoanaerobaculia bacterium]
MKINRKRARWLAVAATALLVASTPAFVPDASADVELSFGASFRIGNVHLSLGHTPYRGGYGSSYGSASDYYYRTNDNVHYNGYECTDRCYRRGRTNYHHQSCPVVLHLLHLNKIHPHDVFSRHSRHYDGRFANYDPYAFHRSYSSRRGGHGRYRDHDNRGHWRDRRGHGRHDRGRHRGWYRH